MSITSAAATMDNNNVAGCNDGDGDVGGGGGGKGGYSEAKAVGSEDEVEASGSAEAAATSGKGSVEAEDNADGGAPPASMGASSLNMLRDYARGVSSLSEASSTSSLLKPVKNPTLTRNTIFACSAFMDGEIVPTVPPVDAHRNSVIIIGAGLSGASTSRPISIQRWMINPFYFLSILIHTDISYYYFQASPRLVN